MLSQLYLKIMVRFSPSWPPFSFSMGPEDTSVENPGKNTDWINLYPMDHLSNGWWLISWIAPSCIQLLKNKGIGASRFSTCVYLKKNVLWSLLLSFPKFSWRDMKFYYFKSVNWKKYDFELFFQVWPLMGKQYSLLLFVSYFLSRFM